MSMWTAVALSLGGLFSGILGSAIIYRLGHRLALMDVPNERSSHSMPTPKGGGVGIWIYFVLVSAFIFSDWPMTLTGAAFGFYGLLADRFSFSAKHRLFMHLAISLSAVILLTGPLTSWQTGAIFAFWIVFFAGTANFYNFMDGINGLAALTGIVGFSLLSLFSYFIGGRQDIALMGIVLASGCLGFLPFNLPRAMVFLGDTGSLFLGFVFAALAARLSSSPGIFLCLAMLLCTFYADAMITILHRIMKGENLMTAHRSHLYQYMSNELKLPHWKVSLLYASIQLVFGIASIAAYYRSGLALQAIVTGVFFVSFCIFYIMIKRINAAQQEGFLMNLLQPSKLKRNILFFFLDVLITAFSLYLAFLLRFDFVFPQEYMRVFTMALPLFVVIRLIVFSFYKIYRITWRYVDVRDFYNIGVASLLAEVAIIASVSVLLPTLSNQLSGLKGFPRGVFLIEAVIFFILISMLRVSKRVFIEVICNKRDAKHGNKTLIIGAGNMGEMILRDIINQGFSVFRPVGFLDDDPRKAGAYIHGIKVLGTVDNLKTFVRQHRIETVIIAIPSLNFKVLRKIYDSARESKVDNIKIMPRIYDFHRPNVTLKSLEEIRVEDLLGRQTITINYDSTRHLLAQKKILVTGAGGSIGSEIIRQICAFNPEKIVLFDNDETSLHDMEIYLKRTFPHFFHNGAVPGRCSLDDRISFIVGDIRDERSVSNILQAFRPEIVFHSAAYKHVPMMEHNPCEAVKVNILGSHIVAKAAIDYGVGKFILISTDKAVKPTSVMGATKRIAEHICKAFNGNGTEFISVRFGNVLGSRGSILPLLMEQLKNGGPLTLTHKDMRRYFMTIPEAVSLVLQASVIGKGGEVLVLDMGEPVSILALSEELIRLNGLQPYKDVDISFIGLRPGENLFEEVLTAEEGAAATSHEKIFVAKSAERHSSQEIEAMVSEFEALVSRLTIKDYCKISETISKYVKYFSLSQTT